MQALVTTSAQDTGIGAGLRVEDAEQGQGTVVAGLGQLEPPQAMRPGDRFRIASCSKTFTAAAIFMLKEQGLVDFDVPIVRYLPQYEVPRKDLLTLRHLLTHTSGLPDHNNDTNYVFEQLAQDPQTYFSPAQVCSLMGSLTNHFMPGADWKYCDSGFYLLHLIIAGANTNGWTYQQFIENKFIQPLGLTNTFVPGPDNGYLATIPGHYVHGYALDDSGNWVDVTEMNQSFDMGCGGMVSTLDDLCAWGRALYTGRVISSNSLAEMWQVSPQAQARGVPYGMGVMVSPVSGYGHDGDTPGYSTRFSWDPVLRTAYATVVNAPDGLRNPGGGLMLQAKHLLGHPDRFPALVQGQTTTGTLSANQTTWFKFDASAGVYYGVWLTNASTNISLTLRTADTGENLQAPTSSGRLGWACSNDGTYYLGLTATAATPYGVRLYTLTNTLARLSNLVTNLLAQNNLVGCGLSLVDNGQTVWKTGFGDADRERGIRADQGTVFLIGSCSKTFGAIAAMQLVEEGLLELDAPFTNALPSFSIHQRFADSITTPRTILTHHSGLPGDIFTHGFTSRPNYGAPDQLQALLAEEYVLMPTDTCWAYNNSGFVMLGQAFRHITGQELPAFSRSRLFDRMGMDNSSIVYDLPYIKEHLSRPYLGGAVCPDEYCDLFFAGSIYSTAEDMARYMNMLLNGGMGERARVLSKASLDTMSTSSNDAIPLDQFNSALNMGIGFVLDPPWLNYLGKVIWHNGGTIYFRTLMRVATEAQLGCFVSCNSAEAAEANEQIVNSALQWAYEEKTGIAPPPAGGPGTPAPATAPSEALALATGGDFVTASGYDRFETNACGLMAHFNAQVPGLTDQQFVYRDNGWFTPTNAYTPQLSFTQCAGHVLCLSRAFSRGITNLTLRGERAAGIDGFASAWNPRLGRWWATDLAPDDLSWILPGAVCNPMLELYTTDSHLEVAFGASRSESTFVLSATNEVLAFAAGLGRNKGAALRVLDDGALAFMGIHYRPEAGMPFLGPNAATNGLTVSNEVHWLRLATQPGAPLTVDLATEHDLSAYLYDTNCNYLGQANRAHAFHLPASNSIPLVAAIVPNGTNPGPWRLALHTQDLPFYQALPFEQWPAQFAAQSNLFPRTRFGYVFVHENHAAPSGNVLKLAVAKMASTNAAAPPLLFCSGGPGNWSIFSMYQHELKTYFSDYDVYLPDQRGVGFSQPNLDKWPGETDNETLYRLRFLSAGDYATVHTAESALDLMDIHAALGLGQANVWGLSYGTMLAETLMRLNPPWLRAVVLDGILAPNCRPYTGLGKVTDNALANLFADVAADPLACRYYPNFEQTFKQFAAALEQHPLEWVSNGKTNRVDGTAFISLTTIPLLFNDLGNRHLIPSIVWRAMHGDPAALGQLVQFPRQTQDFLDNGYTPLMSRLVLRHDFLPFESLADVANANASLWPPLGDYATAFAAEDLGPALSLPEVGSASLTFTQALSSTVATLCLNGLYDTQTGTNWAAEVARQLPNSQLVLVPTVGHQTLLGGEGPRRLIRDFLQNPGQPLDTSCLATMKLQFPVPWPTNAPALGVGTSIAGTIDAATSSQWYQVQPAGPLVGVDGVTNLYYGLKLDGAPEDLHVRLFDAANGSCVAERCGNGSLLVSSGVSPLLLNVVPEAAGSSTGAYHISFNLPLLIRDIRPAPSEVTLLWQGPTNGLLTIEAASRLDAANCFEPLLGNISATNLLQRQTIPMDPKANRFYRLKGNWPPS